MIAYDCYLSLIGDAQSVPTVVDFMGKANLQTDVLHDVDDYVTVLKIIYTVANGTIKDIMEISGLKMTQFARLYDIKYRTIQDWVYGKRPNNECINRLIGYAMISDICAKSMQKSKGAKNDN
jgi:DNA-binding transcriptional regulator YiaG